MIKFFRNIRQGMIKEKKISKYLLRERTKSVKFYATTLDAIEDLMAKIERELKSRT